MSDIYKALILVCLAWVIPVVAFYYLARRRWFARFEKGFVLMVMCAITGMALMAASVIGIWGYQSCRIVVSGEIVVELQNVADIVQSQVQNGMTRTRNRLNSLARGIAPLMQRKATPEELASCIRTISDFDSRYLQLRIIDKDERILATTGVNGPGEPLNHIGAAFTVEGKDFISEAYFSPTFKRQVIYIGVPIKSDKGELLGGVNARFDLQTLLTEFIGGAKFNQSGYAVILNSDGHIMAHPDPARIGDDISSYEIVKQAMREPGSGSMVQTNKAGEDRLMVYRTIKSPATIEGKPWILLAEINEAEALSVMRTLRDEFAFGLVVLLVASVVLARQLAVSIRRPVQRLQEMAREVRKGDLAARTAVGGRDEMGQLGTALNEMAAGLQERERMRDVFGRYIATQVSEKILKGEVNLGGEMRRVTILFSDIRNFSAMSEQLTPQQVVSFLNNYFSEMVEAVFEQGGVLDKFMGDGLMAVFGSIGDQPDHPRRAVLAALRMKALLAKINGERSVNGLPPISIGIGVHTDDVVVGNIGSRRRLEYTVIGDGVNTTNRVQALNKQFGTTLLITQPIYDIVKDEFECHPMPDVQLRGKTKTLNFYEVVSAKG